MGFFGDLFGGASGQDKAIAKGDFQFMQTMQNEQNIAFQGFQDALNTVKARMTPIANGGIYQYGFSTPEDQNLQNLIETQGALGTAHSVAAEQLRQQQLSGGAEVLPTGAQATMELQARETGAQKTAEALAQEKELGYQVGRENFLQSTGALERVAGLENPTGFANAATSAEGEALNAQKQVDKMNANSLTSKILGGVIGGAVGYATGGPAGAAKGFAGGYAATGQNS